MKTNAKAPLPFRYPGGKYYAMNILRPFWESIPHKEYREPFAGGATVFFNKPKAQSNWLNDLDSELMCCYKVMQDKELRIKLADDLSNEIASKERWKEVFESLPSCEYEIARKYYYLNRTSFSGKLVSAAWGYRPKRSLPPERWKERILPCGTMLENVKLTSVDFTEVIRADGEDVLMYVDPPYYLPPKHKHYRFGFDMEDHVRLAKELKNTKHKFFLTYDDCEEVRELYSWANIYSAKFFYRVDNSTVRGGERQIGFELIITNFKLPSLEQTSLFDDNDNDNNYSDIQASNNDIDDQLESNVESKAKNEEEKCFFATPYKPSCKVKSPLRYPGGKFYALKHIMPYIECVPHDEYREPFFGGGTVFFAKEKAQYNILNDLESEIINFYRTIQQEDGQNYLISCFEKEIATKERHSEVKKLIPKNDYERAFKTYYLNRTSYSGIINAPAWGYADGKSSPPQNWHRFIENASKKLADADLYCVDFREIINLPARGENVLMYLDPPYFHADQKRAYTCPFETEDHVRLAEQLKETPYMFCLSYDDCEEVRELYSWANIYDVSWLYNTDNLHGASRKACKEVVITNYRVLHE